MRNKLEEIWKEVLGLDEVQGEANFFDIGGTSLLTYKICQIAKERYDINIKPIDIMTSSTFDNLCEFLENSSEGKKVSKNNVKVRERRRR